MTLSGQSNFLINIVADSWEKLQITNIIAFLELSLELPALFCKIWIYKTKFCITLIILSILLSANWESIILENIVKICVARGD